MKNIKDIFYNGLQKENENIIKTVGIEIKKHKKGIINILNSKIPNYIFDVHNKKIISDLFAYFTGDLEYCEKNNIDLNKSIYLCGGVGTGKSELVHTFKIYTSEILRKNSFQMYISSEITDAVHSKGVVYLEKFNENIVDRIPQPVTMYVDDLGCKNEIVNHYGTQINVMENLISIRYNIFKKHKKLTHFTSNILPKELVNIYDLRTIDRIKEMCNILILDGKSRRK